MAVAVDVTPAEKVERARRVQQLASGTVRIPLACGDCFGTNLDRGELRTEVKCLSCGRVATEKTLHTIRRQRIARFIRTGDR